MTSTKSLRSRVKLMFHARFCSRVRGVTSWLRHPDRVKTIATRFANLAPDLSRLIIEFARGEILNRPGLSLKSREFATLAMVTALGNQSNSVEAHVEGALRTGATETEIKELLLQMTVYAGYAKTLTAVTAAQQIFVNLKQRGIPATSPQPDLESRRQAESNEALYRRGLEALNQISKASGEAVVKSFEDIAPDLGRYILEFSYGEVFYRPNLDLKTRELATVHVDNHLQRDRIHHRLLHADLDFDSN